MCAISIAWMRRLCVAGLLLAIPAPSRTQEPAGADSLARLAQERMSRMPALWERREYGQAAAMLEELRATRGMQQLEGAWIGIHYNLACAYSLLGQKEKALGVLEQAVAAGYGDYEHLRQDSDLDPLHGEPRFERLVARLRSAQSRWRSPVWSAPAGDHLSEEEKLAGLSRVWAEVKYGFAGFDRVPEVDWDSLYVSYIPRVQRCEGTLAYYRLLQEMCARLRDGHTGVNVPGDLFAQLYSRPPLDTRLIEDRVVVTAVLSDSLRRSGIAPGWEIMAVDGTPVKEYAERQVAPYVNASAPQGRALSVYGLYLLCGSPARPVALELRDPRGRAVTRVLGRSYGRILSVAEPVEFRRLPGHVAYVALNTFAEERVVSLFDSVFTMIADCRALVLDLRRNTGGNSDRGFGILACLTDQPFTIPRCARRPYDSYLRSAGEPQAAVETARHAWPADGSRHFAGLVALLIGSQTGSAAEDFCLAFKVMGRGFMIGEPTAGSTGQPLVYALPGGGSGFVCTLDCTDPDGAPFVGVGLQPDLLVRPTVRDIREGRDPVLETALQNARVRRRTIDGAPRSRSGPQSGGAGGP